MSDLYSRTKELREKIRVFPDYRLRDIPISVLDYCAIPLLENRITTEEAIRIMLFIVDNFIVDSEIPHKQLQWDKKKKDWEKINSPVKVYRGEELGNKIQELIKSRSKLAQQFLSKVTPVPSATTESETRDIVQTSQASPNKTQAIRSTEKFVEQFGDPLKSFYLNALHVIQTIESINRDIDSAQNLQDIRRLIERFERLKNAWKNLRNYWNMLTLPF